MAGYYESRLSSERLRRVYEIAPPRVRQYLDAEADFVARQLAPSDIVLELGCGYGRVLARLAGRCRVLIGVDTSLSSLATAADELAGVGNIRLLAADAVSLPHPAGVCDVVACVQNGVSAFGVDQQALLRESLRVVRPGGVVLFSSYSARFWRERMEWFELQAREGLIGEIDHERTGDGVIVCKDGFRATTVDAAAFEALTKTLHVEARIEEVDGSSLFCVIRAAQSAPAGSAR